LLGVWLVVVFVEVAVEKVTPGTAVEFVEEADEVEVCAMISFGFEAEVPAGPGVANPP
jgi:hypothetical protein